MISRDEIRELEDLASRIRQLIMHHEKPSPINTDHEFSEEIRKLGYSLINWVDNIQVRSKL